MNIDLSKLREMTNAAIQRGNEEKERKLALIEEKRVRQARADQLLAEQILTEIPSKCEQEAARERSHAIVMSLRYGRDYIGNSETDLKGPGAIVWNHLVEQGLNPTLEYWHDGVGVESGYNIVIKW